LSIPRESQRVPFLARGKERENARERATFPGYHAGIVSCEKETSGIERARGPFPGYYTGHCFLRREESGRDYERASGETVSLCASAVCVRRVSM